MGDLYTLMATALLFSTIFWLYLRAASATSGLPDIFVPSTSGYLCSMTIFDIKFLKEEAGRAFKKFTHQSFQSDFPALFEDSYLFGKFDEILLAWPLSFPGVPYENRVPGNYRIIIDSNGEVIGVVTVIYPEKVLQQKEFRRCTPIHSFKDGKDDKAKLHTKQLERRFRFMGYSCNGEFLEERAFSKNLDLIRISNLNSKTRFTWAKKISRYDGKEFTGNNLLGFPLRKLDSSNKTNGPLDTHRIIFQRGKDNEILVKGVVSKSRNKSSPGKQCPKLWDLSPLLEITPDVSSPISRKIILANNDGTFTCAKQELNISTILLQVPVGMIQAEKTTKPSDEKYPILQNNALWLWPIRLPESYRWSLEKLFAIGYSLEFQVVGLFFTDNTDEKNPRFYECGKNELSLLAF
ncbi:BgTH12-02006 [Blumeria graminis f. sp. triticale]|nr:BgTH12-02006 [Blumeria graminis f. sp. triticale]